MTKQTRTKKPLPFRFVLDELEARQPLVKPMFGCHAIYLGEKLVLFLCDSDKWAEQKGLWLPTTPEHYANLAQEFASARPLMQDKVNKSPWLLLPVSAPDFEAQALRACELILQGDPRIGRIPRQSKLKPQTSEIRKSTKKTRQRSL